MIGLHTAPYGMLRFATTNRLTGLSRRDMIAEIWPFLAMLMAALLVVVLAPEAVLGLRRPFGRGG